MRRASLLVFVLIVMFAEGCATGSRGRADFVIDGDSFAGPELVGIGVELHPYVFCAPNWGVDVNEQNVKIFEHGLIELRPQHVRIFAEKEWWMPELKEALHPERKASFFKVLELAKRTGTSVNMTLWHGPYPNIERCAQAFCDGVVETIRTRGFTNVKYVTLQNEVNYTSMKPADYVALHKAFDKALKAEGLRDQIQIIGGDLVGEHQVLWFGALGEDLHDVLDGYSVHIYNEYRDGGHLLKRVREVPVIVNALQRNARKPIYLTEFGVYSAKRELPGMSGYTPEGTPIYDTNIAGVGNAWYILEALNHGYVAMVAWEACEMRYGLNASQHWAHDNSRNGFMAGGKENFRKRPVYHMMQLFTQTTFPGWRAVKVKGDGEDTTVACTRGPKGEWAVYAQNRGSASVIEIRGLPPHATFEQLVWNADGKGTIGVGSAVPSDGEGRVRLDVAGESLVGLTKR
jgi:hypothetical protein